jgi:chorismate mutase / prephenate dehydratase
MSQPRDRSPAAAPEAADDDLARLRAEIDRVDEALLDRLNERARLVREIGALKQGAGIPVYSAARERDLIATLAARNAGPFPREGVAPVFREIVSATRSLERRLRVAYLGPEGTFAHEAARCSYGACTDLCPTSTISEVFAAVERREADMGVVPVENTTQGVVTETLDTLVGSDVTLCGELLLRIAEHLLSRSGRIEDVRRVISHPQALAQCRRWLDRHLPGVERIETPSTARAAQLAAEDPDAAAIGSEIAGETNGLAVAARSIEDRRDNTTRFLLIGREAPARSGDDLTSAVFTVRKAEAGALFRLLEPFARGGVNLTSIQSRPMPGKPWEYLFFFEIVGHRSDPPVARALAEAAGVAHSDRILGSFPRCAREASAPGAPREER